MMLSCPARRVAKVHRRRDRTQAATLSLFGASLLALSGILPDPARAVIGAVPTEGAAALSGKVAITAIASGATIVVKTSGWSAFFGGVLATGGFVLGVVDPPSATFYSGSFTYHYPSSLLGVSVLGWMGSFGADPSLPALPVDPTTWGDGTAVTLQKANAALTATVNDTTPGAVTVSFSDSLGFSVPGSDPFNFFGVQFEVEHPFQVVDLGMGPDPPPPGANFYLSTPGFTCTPPGLLLKETCGESETQYFELRSIPEPSTWILASLGFAAVGALGFWRSRRARPGLAAQ
jgi:hypothetical protein